MRTAVHGISVEVIMHENQKILKLSASGSLIHEDYDDQELATIWLTRPLTADQPPL